MNINDNFSNETNIGMTLSYDYAQQTVVNEPSFTKLQKIMAFAVALLAFFFTHLVLWNVTGIFTTILYITIITAIILFMCKSGKTFCAFNKLCAAVLYLFSFVFAITANEFIKSLDVIFMTAGITYFAFSVGTGSKAPGRFFPIELIKSALQYPFMHFSKEYKAINSTVKNSKFGSSAKLIIVGLIFAVPLTCIVGALLMSADRGVERILINVMNFVHAQNMWTLLLEVCVSIPIGGYIYGILYANTHPDEVTPMDEEKCERLCADARKINNTMIYTAITPICLLYIIFFISQANYFLSAFMGTLPENYSYAEYARKGFFELFAIELINAAVIFFISFFSKNCGREKPKALKFYTVTISVFTLLITSTAISKMIMYINNYGLTQLRVYTTWFMVLTAIMFIFVIIKQFKKDFKCMTFGAAAFTIMFALLCFSRPDALITRYNMDHLSDTLTSYDIRVMKDMSADAKSVLLDEKYKEILQNTLSFNVSANENANDYYSIQTYKYTYDDLINDIKRPLEEDIYCRFNLSAILIEQRI